MVNISSEMVMAGLMNENIKLSMNTIWETFFFFFLNTAFLRVNKVDRDFDRSDSLGTNGLEQ